MSKLAEVYLTQIEKIIRVDMPDVALKTNVAPRSRCEAQDIETNGYEDFEKEDFSDAVVGALFRAWFSSGGTLYMSRAVT